MFGSYRLFKQKNKSQRLDELPRIVVSSNWKVPPVKMPHILIHNQGENIEAIAEVFLQNFTEQQREGQAIVLAGEVNNEPGFSRPVRVINQLQPGHIVATDILFLREGKDLYVRFANHTRTKLACLRRFWFTGLLVLGTLLLFALYLQVTDARKVLGREYAEKFAPIVYPGCDSDVSAFMARRVSDGYYQTDWVGFREEFSQNKQLAGKTALHFYTEGFPGPVGNIDPDNERVSNQEIGFYVPLLYFSKQYFAQPEYLMLAYLQMSVQPNQYYQTFCQDGEVITFYHPSEGVVSSEFPRMQTTDWLKDVNLSETMAGYFTIDKYPEVKDEILKLFEHHTTWNPPMSLIELVKVDPRAAIFSVSLPLGLIMGFVGIFVWRLPASTLRFPCMLLGWILPEDYNDRAVASMASVKRLFTASLDYYGITRDQIDELGDNIQ